MMMMMMHDERRNAILWVGSEAVPLWGPGQSGHGQDIRQLFAPETENCENLMDAHHNYWAVNHFI